MNYFDVVTHEHTYTVSQAELGELMTELQADQVPIVDVSKVDSVCMFGIADHSGYLVDSVCMFGIADHSGYLVDHDNPDWTESAMLGE